MTLRVGLMGAGAIANDHCSKINAHPEAAVAAVADPSRERRESVRRAHGIARGFDSWEALAADPGLDAVVIALPNSLHLPASLAALAAGKHVLLEKPFALNSGEAERIAAAAARRNLVLTVGMNLRYSPEAHALREIVRRGDLGQIYHVKAFWYRRKGVPRFGTWFVNKDLSGGGCLLDIGVHLLDLGLYLSGLWDPVRVFGQTYGIFGRRGFGEGKWGHSDRKKGLKFDVDDSATALIRFGNGATLELNVTWVQHREEPNLRNIQLFGSEAGASLSPVRVFRPSAGHDGEYESVTPQDVATGPVPANRQADWIDAILGRSRPLCETGQALIVQRVLDAIYRSAETGRDARIGPDRARRRGVPIRSRVPLAIGRKTT